MIVGPGGNPYIRLCALGRYLAGGRESVNDGLA